jgi:hypothetical protein
MRIFPPFSVDWITARASPLKALRCLLFICLLSYGLPLSVPINSKMKFTFLYLFFQESSGTFCRTIRLYWILLQSRLKKVKALSG